MVENKFPGNFPVVGIGASAGGLEAIIEILRHLSPVTGMSFIYVQHLDPDHKSLLATILGNITKMKVAEATHQLELRPDHVYVIPHDQDMSVNGNYIHLHPRSKKHGIHMPIDQLFVSLAEDLKEKSIAVLLSGTAHDGTYGIRTIKQAGGITIAQDDTAKFKGMPRSAVDEGIVDLVLPPAEIATELERLAEQLKIVKNLFPDDNDGSENKELSLLTILQLLKKVTNVDFTHYKSNTIRRRIIRRMLLQNLKTLQEYARYLRRNSDELNTLFRDLLINVTSFFRDPDTYDFLEKKLFPKILKSKPTEEALRIWVPACSTGEEAYSIAMIVFDILGPGLRGERVQIFATDLSESVIAKARRGVYTRNELLNVKTERVHRYFTKTDGEFRIIKPLRDICVFATQNVFRDPPFSKMDFISCCNLLIYLDTHLQKKIMETFHYALNPNGFLMLGKSETTGSSASFFTPVEKKYRIFSKRKDIANNPLSDLSYTLPKATAPELPQPQKKINPVMLVPPTDLEKKINEILLAKYIPATVVVNSELEILHFKGSTGLFLEPSPGKASLNLLKMARPGIEFELRNLIHKAGKSAQPVKKTGLEIKIKETVHQVAIEVSPLTTENAERLFLVIFEETPASIPSSGINIPKDKIVAQLQEELKSLREDMRSILGEQEASHEELQSANEEILSNNEELQSINEELETSKEEVESANEELMTINTEIQTRNEQLTEAYEHSEAIIGIIHEAVIVLDKNFQIKTANRAFYKTFRLQAENTEAKLISELSGGEWKMPELKKLLDAALSEKNPVAPVLIEKNFSEVGKKILILNARKLILKSLQQQIILLVIDDVTEQKTAEQIIAGREAWFRTMANDAPVMIAVINKKNRVGFFNKTWLSYTGQKAGEEDFLSFIHGDDKKELARLVKISLKNQTSFSGEFRFLRSDGQYRWMLTTGKLSAPEDINLTGLIVTCTEIHNQRIFSIELEREVEKRTHQVSTMNRDLERSNHDLQQFAYVASHDLQEPLRKIISYAEKLQNYKDQLAENPKTYIQKINEATVRMTNLINDLLNFSSITNSNDKFVSTDLNKIAKTVISDFEQTIAEKKAKLTIGRLPVLPANPMQMGQLFHNVISNALKFTVPGRTPRIKISSRTLSTKDEPPGLRKTRSGYFEITVADNGIGFAKKYAEQIFEVFQRLNERDKYPGTGIGLALCRKIIDNHGGKIQARSVRNKGTVFHIIVPADAGNNLVGSD